MQAIKTDKSGSRYITIAGKLLPEVLKNPDNFINKMTLLYGASDSGKSTILWAIMWILQYIIPHVYCISPTNAANKAFDGRIAAKMICPGTDEKTTISFLERVVTRQRDITEIYERVNNKNVLASIFKRCAGSKLKSSVKALENNLGNILRIIRNMDIDFDEKEKISTEARETTNKKIIDIYKKRISKKQKTLTLLGGFDEYQSFCIKFINTNPHCLLIFDDCASRFKTWVKKSTIIKQIFYEFRQYNGATIVCTQSDKDIDSEFRGNAMLSIFTTDQSAMANFSRKSNHYPKATTELAFDFIQGLYPLGKDGKKHHRKLVYAKGATNPFSFIKADKYPKFRMGAKVHWKYVDEIQERTPEAADSNAIMKKYM